MVSEIEILWDHCKIYHRIAVVTKYFELGWKLTRGSFFNVEYWTLGAFSPLKIETESWKYIRVIFQQLCRCIFLCVWFFMLNIDPRLKSFELNSMNNSPCYQLTSNFFFGRGVINKKRGGWSFCIDWKVSGRKVNIYLRL